MRQKQKKRGSAVIMIITSCLTLAVLAGLIMTAIEGDPFTNKKVLKMARSASVSKSATGQAAGNGASKSAAGSQTSNATTSQVNANSKTKVSDQSTLTTNASTEGGTTKAKVVSANTNTTGSKKEGTASDDQSSINRILVDVPVANVRKRPSTSDELVGELLKGAVQQPDQVKTASDGTHWYHITYQGISGWVSQDVVEKYTPKPQPKHGVILDAPLIAQLPEMQRGCEVTSLAMLINSAGIKVNKLQLAEEIKKDPTKFQYKNGHVFFGNPNVGFVGDIYTFQKSGLGVYHGPIFQLAQKYLGKRAIDITGKGWDAVKKQLDNGKPVWVIITSTFAPLPESQWETWQTSEGPIKITYSEHSVLVTGYDDTHIYFNDPLANIKNRAADKTNFIAAWQQFGMQAVSYN